MAPVWPEGGKHKWECPAVNCTAKGSESTQQAAQKVLLKHLASVHGIR